MNHPLKRELEIIYLRYGFQIARVYETEQVIVFTLKSGYFNNADIVPLALDADTNQAFKDYTDAGFACTTREFLSPTEAEEQLFKGFFSVDSILNRLENDYKKFTNAIVAPLSETAVYKYMNTPYQINGKIGELSPAQEVASRLISKKPTLFLIEAAAGFGKTCTAYEIVNLLTKAKDYLPLFSELARNRQAVIFRHILLDEIDHTFPTLSSRLVQAEMKNGRVITILDGFDELLRKTEEGNDFENKEPMLETIGEFLTGNAKIVLTTRRTVLFEGDAFHAWIDKHIEDFDLIRIKISEPKVTDWLTSEKIEKLTSSGININTIANPVLLSYLRCISTIDFIKVASEPHQLVEKYFEFMLDREKIRQDLRMSTEKQEKILRSIAEDMMAFGYTSENREYIADHIAKANFKIIDETLLEYSASEKPTREELANKLASHALLDRSAREPNKIAFVNEFVFGHFIAQTILNNSEWFDDDIRFIEPAVIAYQPRDTEAKEALWKNLKISVEYLPVSDRIDTTVRLRGVIDFDLVDDEAQNIEIQAVTIGQNKISNFQFNECIFRNCTFNPKNISNTNFLNCRFYGNTLIDGNSTGPIYILGATGDQEFIQALADSNQSPPPIIEPAKQLLIQRFVLEKFWPIGREYFVHKHRPIKGICAASGGFKSYEILKAIIDLKKNDILLAPTQASFVEINVDKINEIREILDRDNANGK
jgi:hypothetical protein